MKKLLSILFLFCFFNLNASLIDEYILYFEQKLESVQNSERFNSILEQINQKYSPKQALATRFYIVRHGNSTANKYRYCAGQRDFYWENGEEHLINLTEEGIEQASIRAQHIRKEQKSEQWNFSSVFSSPSLRAQETAHILLRGVNQAYLPLNIDTLLSERNSGKYEGTKKDSAFLTAEKEAAERISKLETFLEKFVTKWDPQDAEEEPLIDIFRRMHTFFQQTIHTTQHAQKYILVVSHAISMKTLFMAECARKYNVDIEESHIENTNGSVLILDVFPDRVELVKVIGYKFRS
ncbi:MAG: phosphoglycerate mutase family protein [Parachlamydiales bacterium]|jgi:broad specificity phosphatase PhoE